MSKRRAPPPPVHSIGEHGPQTSGANATVFWLGWAKATLASFHAAAFVAGRCGPGAVARCWACDELDHLLREGILPSTRVATPPRRRSRANAPRRSVALRGAAQE